MLLCLSSGARAQYLENVLTALAAPLGAIVQLRYSRTIVSASLTKEQSQPRGANRDETSIPWLTGETTLLCYLDISNPKQPPAIVPYRVGRIEEANLFGETVVLRVALGDFAVARDVDQFNDQAKKASPTQFPTWSGDLAKGKFVFRFAGAAAAVDTAYQISVFERVVAQLVVRKDFSEPSRRALFFHVLSVRPAEATMGSHINLLPPSQPVAVKEGQLNRITIYYYYPESGGRGSKATIFTVAADFDPTIASFGGSETQTISSDYDIVHFDFRVRRGLDDRDTLIRISARPNSNTAALAAEVTFPVRITRDYNRFGLQFAALWAGLSVATITAYISGLEATQSPSYGTLSLILFGTLAATVGALTNLKFKV